MKLIVTILGLALCTAIHAQEAPSLSPSVEYTFDACDGTDDTGHGNDGTFNGVVKCVGGAEGKAIAFDGATTYMTAPSSSYFIPGSAVTYTIWIKPDFPGGYVFRKNTNAEDVRMFIDGAGHIGMGLYPCFNNGNIYTTNTLPLGAWTFVAAVFDGLNLKYYLNGQLDSTTTGGACQVGFNGATLLLGASNGSYTRGTLDDFRLYQAVLTDAQVLNIYKSVGGGAPPTIHGTAPWKTTHTVDCQNLTQGTSVQIGGTKASAWDCEKAGLVVDDGDKVKVTIQGSKK